MSTEHDVNIEMADILIVDDESANLKLLSEILGREGCRVRPANSPRLAIESAYGKPPDLILLDIRMPDMDGFEVCARLKQDERTREIPILFISALQETRDKVRAFEAGGVDFITKPFQEEEVLARVRTHLKLRSMQRDLEELLAERTDKLTESEMLFSTILSATHDIALLFDEKGKVIDCNTSFLSNLGTTREEIIGSCVFDRFPEEESDQRMAWINKVLEEEKPVRFEDYVGHSDKYFQTTLYPIEAEKDEKHRVLMMAQDITERKKAEMELQKSRDYLEHLINSIPDAVFSVKLPERIIEWASDSYNVLSMDLNEVIGKDSKCLYSKEEDYYAFGNKVSQALRSKKDSFITEASGQHQNGEFFPVEISATIYREKGKPVSLTALVRDISDRRKAMEALKNSEARLKEAQRIAGIGNWELDLLTNTLNWSDEIFRIFEIDPKDFRATYEAFVDAIHPDDRDMVEKAYSRSVKSRRPYSIDHRLLIPGGGIKYVHEQCETLYSPEGKPLRSVGTVQDITDRKEMEQELIQKEERLRSAQDLAHLGYWEWDLVRDELTCSDEMYRIYGLDPGTPVTMDDLSDWVHPEDREYRRQLIADLLDGKTAPPSSYRILRPDGSVRYIYGVKQLELDDQGAPSRLKGTLQDVTESKTFEMAYRHSEARLKQSQTEAMSLRLELSHLNRIMTMNELAASFAHELNQPLGAITNNANVAKTLYARSAGEIQDMDEILDDISGDALRAGQIIRKIRGVMSKGDIVLTSLDVNRLLDEVLAIYRNTFDLNHVSVAVEKDPGLLPVKGDQIRLQQVLMNLITNGMEAISNSPRKSMAFRTVQSEDMVKVCVSDTGPGIDQGYIDRVFDPFYTTKSEGMGIGLRLCRTIVEEHGGRIWAENNRDGGATFSFTLKGVSGEHRHELS